MKLLNAKTRLVLSLLIIAAFFVPAYKSISAFNFISLALSETKTQGDITTTDVLVILIPLVFIPVTALLIFIRSAISLSTRTTVITLPLLLLVFFFVLLSMISPSNTKLVTPGIITDMQVGFYITIFSALLLLFTKNHQRRKRRKYRMQQPELQ